MPAGTLDQPAQAVLDLLAGLAPSSSAGADDATWLATFRCQVGLLRGLSGDAEPVRRIDHLVVATPGGAVPVRLYRPRDGVLPVLFHVHGGGGVAGSIDGHDPLLRMLANRTGWLVAAPAYRLAPEHRFPAQIEDCLAALVAVAALPDVDAGRVVVGGDSIGGTIATALAALVRDVAGPPLAGQVLLYPNTDLRAGGGYASRISEDGRMIAADDLERQITLYLADRADRCSPLASPLLASLAGLPPAFVATNGCDPLRDEGVAYAAALSDAGVDVVHRHMAGMIHAFLQMRACAQAAETLVGELAEWLACR